MTLSAPDLRLLAWHQFDCASCGQTVGHRCRTASGALALPHVNRITQATAWDARQPEVDALTAHVDDAEGRAAGFARALDAKAAELKTATDAADALTLQVTNLRAANDQLDTALHTSDDKVTLATQRIVNLTADLRDRTAERDALQARLDAEVAGTLYGMNVSPGTSFTNSAVHETATDQVKRIVSTFGPLPAAKCFYQGNLPAKFNAAYEGLVPGKVAAVCFKSNPDTLASGSLDAAITGYVNSIPAGYKLMLVNWQEPDEEMWVPAKFQFTAAQHRAATDHLCDVVHAADPNRERAEVWDIYMGYSLDVGRFDTAAVSRKLDGLGFDYYWNSATSAAKDPLVPLKKMADQTQSLGIAQWGLFETGDNPDTFKDGAARAAFWTKVFDGCAALAYRYCCYFNAIGTTGDHRILPGQPYSEPLRVALAARMSN